MRLNTVIFDMDGLLIDSEPLWLEAGTELLAQYGRQLTPAQYATTVGLRTREWLEHWFQFFGIPPYTLAEAETQIIDRVVQKIKSKGKPLPGVGYILHYFASKGFKIGVATSSPTLLANVVVEKLGIGSYLQTITSAEALPFGKPHPQVYMQCAQELGVAPISCLCFEDSFNGMIAAKAAKMKCVVVPAVHQLKEACWGAADLKISSLQNFNDLLMMRL